MTPPRPSPVTCLIPFITYGFVPAIQNERAFAFVGIQLILCRYKSCSYNSTTSSLVLKRMHVLVSGEVQLGMMLRTYRECAKVVTSFELPIGGGHN